MKYLVDQIIKIFEINNLTVAQSQSLLSQISAALNANSIVKLKNE